MLCQFCNVRGPLPCKSHGHAGMHKCAHMYRRQRRQQARETTLIVTCIPHAKYQQGACNTRDAPPHASCEPVPRLWATFGHIPVHSATLLNKYVYGTRLSNTPAHEIPTAVNSQSSSPLPVCAAPTSASCHQRAAHVAACCVAPNHKNRAGRTTHPSCFKLATHTVVCRAPAASLSAPEQCQQQQHPARDGTQALSREAQRTAGTAETRQPSPLALNK